MRIKVGQLKALVREAVVRPQILMTPEQYEAIKEAAFELYEKVVGRPPRQRDLERNFFRSYESAIKDLAAFYPRRPNKRNDYPYPLIQWSGTTRHYGDSPFDNGSMHQKFGRTHIRKNASGVQVFAGYLAAGSGGVAFNMPGDMWSKPTIRERREDTFSTSWWGPSQWPGEFWCLVCGHQNNGYEDTDGRTVPPWDCENKDCPSNGRWWDVVLEREEQFVDYEPKEHELRPTERQWKEHIDDSRVPY